MNVECGRCGGRELYEIDEVCMEASDSSNGIAVFALFAHYGPSGEVGWMGEKNKRVSLKAKARVCGGCGYAELFAQDLELLKSLADKHVAGIRKLG